MEQTRRRRPARRARRCRALPVLFALSAGAFALSLALAAGALLALRREQGGFARLRQAVAAGDQAAVQGAPAMAQPGAQQAAQDGGSGASAYVSPYQPLAAENPDFYGWLAIEGTAIDYPVMHTPDDPAYYLHRSFTGERSFSGVPFLDAACTPQGRHALIYGHNMKNGSMFAALPSYADEAFYRAHPRIRFDTLSGPGEYEIVAAFYARALRDGEQGFRFYAYPDLSDKAAFSEFAAQVEAAALYDTGARLAWGDEVLTLSTCSYHARDGRFVVVARRMA